MPPDPDIRIVDYDQKWPMLFDTEKARLEAALGDVAVQIEHMGSTSVPGLAAKPIIDIDIYVREIEPMEPYREPLERLGYLFQFDPEFPDLHFFAYPEEKPRQFHVHVAEVESQYKTRDLAVRDFLRAHPDVAADYAELKRSLTAAHPGDRDAYINGKAAFMDELITRALRWKGGL